MHLHYTTKSIQELLWQVLQQHLEMVISAAHLSSLFWQAPFGARTTINPVDYIVGSAFSTSISEQSNL